MAPPNNLPRQLTSFVGRRREIAEVRRLLASTRLLTLTGAGGCGKTRLALQVASCLLKEYRDGVWFLDLAPLSDPSLVPQSVSSVLGIREQPNRALIESLTEYLQTRRLLLVMDNCEHMIEACASLAETVLPLCPQLHLLATSRQPLKISGEISWRVPSLSLPGSQQQLSIKVLLQYEAVRLFMDRAEHRRPGFDLLPQNAAAVVSLCHQLDGIPLALELAAARVNVLTLEEIVGRLDERFRLLSAASPSAVARHRTLLAALDWGYDLLTEAERMIMRSLFVFANGFTFESLTAVCGGEIDEYGMLDVLSELVDKSFVIVEERDGKSRYRLLETIRQYAFSKAHEASEIDRLRDRHRDSYLDLAEQADPELRGPQQVVWLDKLEVEHDNLRIALEWSLSEGSDATAALRLAVALWRFWEIRGYLTEGRRWLERALAAAPEAEPALRAKALNGAGALARDQGDYAQATAFHEECLILRRKLDDKRGIAISLNNLAGVAYDQGLTDRVLLLLGESLVLWREVGEKPGIALVLNNMALLRMAVGDHEQALPLLEESLVLCRELGDKEATARTLNSLGIVAQEEGDYKRAAALYQESLLLRQEVGDKLGIALCLERLAEVAHFDGNVTKAAQLLGAAEAQRETIGVPLELTDREKYDRNVRAIRTQLGELSFSLAWMAGRETPLDEVIAYALGAELTSVPSATERLYKAYPNDLTKREAEVLGLVAGGLTNKEIANMLTLSVHTVEAHLHSAYSKLGVTTRAAASRFAVEHKLV